MLCVMSICMSHSYDICMVCTDVLESIQSIVCVQVISLNVREHGQRNQPFDFPIPVGVRVRAYAVVTVRVSDMT